LGTKFNVASYDNDEQVTTTLAEGSVEVGDEKGSVRLKPEEQALFCKGDRSLRVQKVDVGMYLAWKDGKFIFEEQSLEQIMKQLQRWYEMSVFYTNEEVKQYTFSGDLKKYDDFDKIIRMLEEVSGIKISIKENCVVIGTK
ncbi:FecR family protein, partial [Odoribacter sp. N15.MGS-14]|uniref:FecR family protein n=1 Tax=Odoribacter sp. N15.MGS-14 TaxID=1637502 RepID=UPI0006232F9C